MTATHEREVSLVGDECWGLGDGCGRATSHEREVSARFDLLEARFRADVGVNDVRFRAIRGVLAPLQGRRVLDLGCGKARFAALLRGEGAEVVGLDLSAGMLAGARGLDRVRGSARRLPFAGESFDGVVAVEVFEHVAPPALDACLAEIRRVLKPGGVVAIVDKSAMALDAKRPWLPSLLVKGIDERRGRWMYPPGGPVREHWFRPGRLRRELARHFEAVRVEFLLSPREAEWALFRHLPMVRLLTLWTAKKPFESGAHKPEGGDRG